MISSTKTLTTIELIHILKTSISHGEEAFFSIYCELIKAYNETDEADPEKEILGELVELYYKLGEMFLNSGKN